MSGAGVEKFLAKSKADKDPRCPYCIVDNTFHPMDVLPNGRMICKNCGHIIFPNDTAFRCPCSKCLELVLSPRMRRLMRKPARS